MLRPRTAPSLCRAAGPRLRWLRPADTRAVFGAPLQGRCPRQGVGSAQYGGANSLCPGICQLHGSEPCPRGRGGSRARGGHEGAPELTVELASVGCPATAFGWVGPAGSVQTFWAGPRGSSSLQHWRWKVPGGDRAVPAVLHPPGGRVTPRQQPGPACLELGEGARGLTRHRG